MPFGVRFVTHSTNGVLLHYPQAVHQLDVRCMVASSAIPSSTISLPQRVEAFQSAG
jgi:hypothetical protein